MTWRLDSMQRLVIGWRALKNRAIKGKGGFGIGATFAYAAPPDFAGVGALDVQSARAFRTFLPPGCFAPPALFEASNTDDAGRPTITAPTGKGKLGGAKFSHALLVEDNLLIAVDLEQALDALGVAKVSIAATVEEALDILRLNEVQFALLDLGLGGELSLPVAERLIELEIPFAFATGFSRQIELGPHYEKIPMLQKPFGKEELRAFLQSLHGK